MFKQETIWALPLVLAKWLANKPSPVTNPIVAPPEKFKSPHLYVNTANDREKSVASIPWNVFVCGSVGYILCSNDYTLL